LNEAVAKAGYASPCPSGGKVGYIPFLLGGGANSLAGMYGVASDSLVSARVITSKGIIEVSAEEEKELFWGLKGAGWFFGVVVEVTVKIYKLENEVISWTVLYSAEKVVEVAGVLEGVVNGIDGRSSGMCAIVAPPGGTKVSFHILEKKRRGGIETDATYVYSR
jgi:FAD/FMN-containing dehydrogenase